MNGVIYMIKQTLSALAISLLVSGAVVAHEATKESCEAAIATHEKDEARADAVKTAKEALAKSDFAACAKAFEAHTEETK